MKGKKVRILLISLCLGLVLVLPLMAGCIPTERPEIILGAPLPLLYPDGICARDNLQLAVDEINGGVGVDVNGTAHNFKLVWRDTRDLEPGVPIPDALAVVEDLISNQDADFIIGGPCRSEIALATMDLVSDNKTVTIWSAGFLSPEFGTKVSADYNKYKYCFRTQGSVVPLAAETCAILNCIANNKSLSKEAYIMCQDVNHAVSAANEIKNCLESAGWIVHSLTKFSTGTTDFSSALLSANVTGAPFLVLWFDMPDSQILIEQWYDWQFPMLPVGFVVPAHDSMAWNTFGGKCEYLVNCYPKAGITPINSEAAHYISLGDRGRTWVAPVCYQLPYVLKDALERAGSLDADAMINALEATNMTGVYGKISFNPTTHDIIYSTNPSVGAITTWVQWIGGERVPVYPPSVGNCTDIQLPDWM